MPACLKLKWTGESATVAVEADGREHLVPRLSAHCRVAAANQSGDRGSWTELALFATATGWMVRSVDVQLHEGGEVRTSTDYVSDDGGATWRRLSVPIEIANNPVDRFDASSLYYQQNLRAGRREALRARLRASQTWPAFATLRFVGPGLEYRELAQLFCACLGLSGCEWTSTDLVAVTQEGEGAIAALTMSGAVQYDCEYLDVDAVAGEVRLHLRCGGFYPAEMNRVDGGFELPLTIFSASREAFAAAAPRIEQCIVERGFRRA
jgi:hypothetical protein